MTPSPLPSSDLPRAEAPGSTTLLAFPRSRLVTLSSASALVGFTSLLVSALGLVRAKVLAVTLGPSGVGVLGQATTLVLGVAAVCALGLGPAVVRELKQRRQRVQVHRTVTTQLCLQLGVALGLSMALWLGSSWASEVLFGDEAYGYVIQVVGLALPFAVATIGSSSWLQALATPRLNGWIWVLTSALSTTIVVLFAISRGASGAVLAVALGAIAASGLQVSAVLLLVPDALRGATLSSFDRQLAPQLLRFGSVTLLAAGLDAAVGAGLRAMIIAELGMASGGWYQASIALLAQYEGLFSAVLVYAFYPRVSGLPAEEERAAATARMLRISASASLPMLALAVLFGGPVLHVLYSAQFDAAHPVLLALIPGALYRVLYWVLTYALLASGRLGTTALFVVFLNPGLWLGGWLGLRLGGLAGLAWGYSAVSAASFFGLGLFAFRRETHYRPMLEALVIGSILALMSWTASSWTAF